MSTRDGAREENAQMAREAAASAAARTARETRSVLEVLVEIRDILKAHSESVAVCPHGFTGICMYCVIQGDLLRPRKE